VCCPTVFYETPYKVSTKFQVLEQLCNFAFKQAETVLIISYFDMALDLIENRLCSDHILYQRVGYFYQQNNDHFSAILFNPHQSKGEYLSNLSQGNKVIILDGDLEVWVTLINLYKSSKMQSMKISQIYVLQDEEIQENEIDAILSKTSNNLATENLLKNAILVSLSPVLNIQINEFVSGNAPFFDERSQFLDDAFDLEQISSHF
jgi:hypothetical protein